MAPPPPALTATADNPTFYENSFNAVAPFSNAVIAAGGHQISELQLTVSNVSADDELTFFTGRSGLNISLTDGWNGTDPGNESVSVSVSGGTATVTITNSSNFTVAAAESLLDNMTFSSASTSQSTRVVTLTNIVDTASVDNTAALNIASTVTLSTAPYLTATADNPTYYENGSAVTLFGNEFDVEPAPHQMTELQITVGNLSASDNEALIIDGATVALTNGNSVYDADHDDISVSRSGTTATVTIANSSGVYGVHDLVNGLKYEDASSPLTTGTRTVTLTEIQDNATTENTTTLDIVSTVTVDAVNHAPSLVATADNPTFAGSSSPVALFGNAAVSVNDTGVNDTGEAIASLQLTVANLSDGANEKLVIDGTAVALTNGNSVTTATDGDHVAVSVSGSTATVTITNASDFTAAAAQNSDRRTAI